MKNIRILLLVFPFCLSALFAEKVQQLGASLDGYRFEFPCKGKMPEGGVAGWLKEIAVDVTSQPAVACP